jgi:D-lactate dehydrogenase
MTVVERTTLRQALHSSGLSPDRVHDRAIDLAARAGDASHYQLTPAAVVVAHDADDVAQVLAGCSHHGVGVTFRSGGTSLSGQGVTDQVLVDTRRHFRGVEVLDGGMAVRAQPGATVRSLNAALKPFGRRFGPDPASEGACTVGGVVANNSSGMSCGTHANAYRTLLGLDLVLPSGTRVDTGRAESDDVLRSAEPGLHAGLLELRDRVREDPESVATVRRLFAIKNTMGYGVNAFLDHDRAVDILAHLVVGSEGTLAFVASGTFSTVPAPPHASTGLLVLPSLADAAAVLPAVAATGAVSIELMDARSLSVAARGDRPLPGLGAGDVTTQAALLVEYHAEGPEELATAEARAGDVFAAGGPGTQALTRDASRRADLWHVRKGLYAAVAGARPQGSTALLEDVAVPSENLALTCEGLTGLFEQFGYDDTVIFGHAKDGNLHFLVNERFDTGIDRYAEFTEAMVDLVLEHGGTLKAEHGTGRVMAPYVRRQYGDRLYGVMRELKGLCDPRGVLNPGVVLTDDPELHLRHLKQLPQVEEEVDRCTECGYCEPVCPSRDLTLTPRQRIVVRRAIVAAQERGDRDLAERLTEEYDYPGLQTCAADGMCQTACPVQIDTGRLVRRLRAAEAPATAQRLGKVAARHWGGATGAVRVGLDVAARFPAAAAAASHLGRRVLGPEVVPEYDRLPRGGTRRSPWPVRGEPAAIVVPSCTVGMFGSDGADALAALRSLCEKAGVSVAVPAEAASLCCGMPWSSKGLADGYAEMVAHTRAAVERLDPDRRLPVVADASSCTEGLAKALEEEGWRVEDAVAFVAREVLPKISVDRLDGRLAVHPTCSSQRLDGSTALLTVARALAEDVWVPPSWGCCAFAGDRGLLHPELTESATRAQADQVRASGAQWHVSCNRTCELGMTRATGEGYRHVLQLLDERSTPSPT